MVAARLGPVLVLGLVACATPKPYDPFEVPAGELRARVDTIAVMPLRVSSTLADPREARAKIEPLVAERLERGGFRVVPSARADELWRAAAAAVGDVYDPKTGEANKERWEAVESAVYQELSTRHGADAVLYLGIDTVDLQLASDSVWFCGKRGKLYWPTSTGSMTLATLARAACFNVSLYDLEERRIYAIRHGITTTETYRAQMHAERPQGAVLEDVAALETAIQRTIGPLAGETQAAE